jgi:hypothetical protein
VHSEAVELTLTPTDLMLLQAVTGLLESAPVSASAPRVAE